MQIYSGTNEDISYLVRKTQWHIWIKIINFFADMTLSIYTTLRNCSKNYQISMNDDLYAVKRHWGEHAVMGWTISTTACVVIWSCLLPGFYLAPQASPKQVPCDKTRKVFTDSWGIISDGPMGSNYTQNSHCEWLIKGTDETTYCFCKQYNLYIIYIFFISLQLIIAANLLH